MTEEEAKTRPCIGPNPKNTGWLTAPNEQGVSVFVCRGSVCLAWRDDPRLKGDGTPFVESGHGYCGLADKP